MNFDTITYSYSVDLQLFAYNPQSQPVNHTGAESLAAEDKKYYDKTLIRYAQPNLLHDQFGQKRNIPARSGQKAEFRSFASLGKQTTPLVEGVTPDPQSLSVSIVEAKVYQYGGFVAMTDMLNLTSIDPVITETVRLIGDQAGISMDTVIRDVLNTGENCGYASTYSADGTETETYFRHQLDETAKLTVKEVEKAVTELRSQNAPTFDGYYICIAHPRTLFDLMRDDDWRKSNTYTSEVTKIYKGEVGEIGGCRFVKSTEAKIIKGADLSSTSRNLTTVSANENVITVQETPTTGSLIGRFVIINGNRFRVTANAGNTITVDGDPGVTGAGVTIYPGEGGKNGCAVFCNLFFGKDAYGTTEIEGGGLETIIKQCGSAGTADPLNQRSTVGWKGLKAAEILIPEYIRRVETAGTYAASVSAN